MDKVLCIYVETTKKICHYTIELDGWYIFKHVSSYKRNHALNHIIPTPEMTDMFTGAVSVHKGFILDCLRNFIYHKPAVNIIVRLNNFPFNNNDWFNCSGEILYDEQYPNRKKLDSILLHGIDQLSI